MMPKMTPDLLIDICEKQYDRGAATARNSAYDHGYADAFKMCLSFAKELKEELEKGAKHK